jgi:hypothetical protein
LIVPSKQLALIQAGHCTRLLVPRGAELGHLPPYSVGSRVALQEAANAPARARVILGRVTDVALGSPDIAQELAELGYRDIYELQAEWVERVGTWRTTDRAWLYRIVLDTSAPSRLLHQDSSHGYTTDPHQALHAEPEAVDDFFLAGSRRAAHTAEHTRLEQERAAREQLPLHERLRLVTEDAARLDIPLTPEINAVRDRIRDLERRILRPVDRNRDAEVAAPAEEPSRRRRRKRSDRERASAQRRKPGPLTIRHVDPIALRASQPLPRGNAI